MYIRPGFIVVIVGCVLTGLSTVVMALRYVDPREIILADANDRSQLLLSMVPSRNRNGDGSSHVYRSSMCEFEDRKASANSLGVHVGQSGCQLLPR